jgi:hypothetical protein
MVAKIAPAITALWVVAGCAKGGGQLWLDLPPLGMAKSALFVLERLDRNGAPTVLAASALDLSTGVATSFDDLPSSGRITALLFEQTLGALNLEEGPLPTLSSTVGSAPTFFSSGFTRPLTSASAWTPISGLDDAIGALKVPIAAPRACAVADRFAALSVSLGVLSDVAFAAAIDSQHFLVGGNGGELRAVSDTAGRAVSASASFERPADAQLVFINAWADQDRSTIWLVDHSGQLYQSAMHGTTLAATQTIAAPARHAFKWFTGGHGANGLELYGLSYDGAMMGFDPSVGWAHWYTFPLAIDPRGGIAYVGPGEVLAVHNNGGIVAHLKNRAVTTEMIPTMNVGLTAIANVPGYRPIAADGTSRFYRAQPDGWKPLPESGFSLITDVVVPYPPGFVFFGANGWVGLFDAGRAAFCEGNSLTPGTAYSGAVIGSRIFLATSQVASDVPLAVTVLEPRP